MTMNSRPCSLLCVAAACLLLPAGLTKADSADKKRSPYAGKYKGIFTAMFANGNDQEGEITVTVDDDGNSKGESFNKTMNDRAAFKGTILKDNKIATIFQINNGTAQASAFGTISKTSEGGMTGTMVERVGGRMVCAIEFDLKPVLEKEKKADTEKEKDK
jgi:hypothetical protein